MLSDTYGISTQQATADASEKMSGFITFPIADPTHLISLFHSDIRSGGADLYPWQIRVHQRFARMDLEVNYQGLVANNGSGKSQFIIAPCAVWLGMAFTEARCVVTSSSGQQLDNQTCKFIVNLLTAINAMYGEEIWRINYRHYTNTKTGSDIICYATDDPGKAEGFHPIKVKGKFAIFVDEAKSIPVEIFQAIDRCTGNTHRLDVSSPGGMSGTFYENYVGGDWFFTKVSCFDCPHIKPEAIEKAKKLYGEGSAFFRSAYLGEFTSTEETVVMSKEQVSKVMRMYKDIEFPHYGKGKKRTGVDLSFGGKDESVWSQWDGGKQLVQEVFFISDIPKIAEHMIYLIRRYDQPPEEINVDDGNNGKAVIDILWSKGFMVNRVLNQHKALDTTVYANRGAELWFNFQRGLLEGCLMPINDPVLLGQLGNRYYRKHQQSGKIVLESKIEARKNGHGSPDRADAAVLAFARVSPHTFDTWKQEAVGVMPTPKAEKIHPATMTTDQLVELMEKRRNEYVDGLKIQRGGRNPRGLDLYRMAQQKKDY